MLPIYGHGLLGRDVVVLDLGLMACLVPSRRVLCATLFSSLPSVGAPERRPNCTDYYRYNFGQKMVPSCTAKAWVIRLRPLLLLTQTEACSYSGSDRLLVLFRRRSGVASPPTTLGTPASSLPQVLLASTPTALREPPESSPVAVLANSAVSTFRPAFSVLPWRALRSLRSP